MSPVRISVADLWAYRAVAFSINESVLGDRDADPDVRFPYDHRHRETRSLTGGTGAHA